MYWRLSYKTRLLTCILTQSIILISCETPNNSSFIHPEENAVVQSQVHIDLTVNQNTNFTWFQNLKGTLATAFFTNAFASGIDWDVRISFASTTPFTVDISHFIPPTITNSVLDFGYLEISELDDPDTKVCGTNGKTQCTTARIRLLTTGTSASGLYNSIDQYSVPLTAGHRVGGTTPSYTTVGLGVSGSATLQTYTLPDKAKSVDLTNFPSPTYSVRADFTHAGAGTYTTTLALQYVLE